MIQPRLFQIATVDTGLTCSYGEAWEGDHPLCRAEVDRMCVAFDAAVARGEFDLAGFTKTERKAQAKRLAQTSADEAGT